MRNRLIEQILECDKEHDVLACYNDRPRKRQAAKIIADKLLANGVIVPPCKVGDVVYEIIPKCSAPWNYCPYNGGYGTSRCDKNPCKAYIKESKFALSDLENVSKTVFLSREEAEKALAERSGDNG